MGLIKTKNDEIIIQHHFKNLKYNTKSNMKATDNKYNDLFGIKTKSNRRFTSVKSTQRSYLKASISAMRSSKAKRDEEVLKATHSSHGGGSTYYA